MSRSASASLLVLAALAAGAVSHPACAPAAADAPPVASAAARPAPPVPTPDSLARLVPDGAIAFVRLESLDACEELLRDLTRPFDAREAARLEIGALLREASVPGDMRAVDRTRPLGIAVNLDRERNEPLLTVIVPARDRAAFEASVSRLATAAHGDYLGASQVPGYAAGAGPHALAGHLPAGPLALHLDLEALIGAYRSKIDLFSAGMFNLMRSTVRGEDEQSAKLSGLLDAYQDGLRAVIDSAERLEVGASMRGANLELTTDFWAVPGSSLGTLGGDEPTDIAALADTLGFDGQVVFLAGMDMAALGRRFERMSTAIVQLVPEPMQDAMAELMQGWDAVYAAMGSGFAGSVSLGEGGMRIAQVLQPADVDALFEMYRRVYSSEKLLDAGLILEPPRETQIDGVRVLALRMDVATMVAESGMPYSFTPAIPGAAPVDTEAMFRESIARLYGTDGTSVRVASKADRLAVLMGGDEAWADAAIARMQGGGAVPEDIAAGLARVARMNPCLVTRVDLGRLLGEWVPVMQAVLGEDALPPGPVPSAPMLLSLGIAGRTWKGHTSIDLQALGAAVTRLMDR